MTIIPTPGASTTSRVWRIATATTALSAYVVAVVAANVLTNRYGRWPVAPGLDTTAGTYAAGIALLARDAVQETTGRWAVRAAIGVGALLSAAFAGVHLALASGLSFALAEALDMYVYTRLRERDERRRWVGPVMWSNAAGAVLDTFLFLFVAGFPITVSTVAGQFIGKLVWATAVPVLVVFLVRKVGRRAVPQPTVGT